MMKFGGMGVVIIMFVLLVGEKNILVFLFVVLLSIFERVHRKKKTVKTIIRSTLIVLYLCLVSLDLNVFLLSVSVDVDDDDGCCMAEGSPLRPSLLRNISICWFA